MKIFTSSFLPNSAASTANINNKESVIDINNEEPVIEESEEKSYFEFPRFFTLSGIMRRQNNPERNVIHSLLRKIQEKETLVSLKNREKKNQPYVVITENERASYIELVKELEDLKIEKMKLGKLPQYITKLVGRSSPPEVFPYIIFDELEDLETNISYFIEENPTYFVTYIGKDRGRNVTYEKFMFQKK